MPSRTMLVGLALIAVVMMGADGGCGQSNLFEGFQNSDDPAVQLENARIAIDEGNYAEAIAWLERLCGTDPAAPTCDDATAALLASAHMGRAGFNAFDLLAQVETLDSTDPSALYDVFAALIDPASLADLAAAITLLEGIARSAEEDLLLAMASAAHLVGSVLVAADQGDGTYGRFVVDATLTATVEADMSRLIASAAAVEAATGILTITDELQAFQYSIENADGAVLTANDGTIEQAELQAFVNAVYP